jgi:predicted transcriptional regulator
VQNWKLREKLVEDDRLRKILEIVRSNPGISISKLHKFSNYAVMTVRKKLEDLEKYGLIEIKGVRKQASGKPNQHYITELGKQILEDIEKIPHPSALVQITFSNSFLKTLGEKKGEEIQSVFTNPLMKDAFSVLFSRLVLFWVDRLHKEPSYMCSFLDEYDKRFYFMGSLPDDVSGIVRELIEKHVFSDEAEAFSFLVSPGIQALKEIKKTIETDANAFYRGEKGIANLVGFRMNPETKRLEPFKPEVRKIGKGKFEIDIKEGVKP